MTQTNILSAELFVATGCIHCPIVLKELSEQLKKGALASLNVTNIAVDNQRAAELNIRSVPWFSLRNDDSFMIFSGEHSPKEIQQWLSRSQAEDAMQEYIEEYLSAGQLLTVIQAVQIEPKIFNTIISMLEDEETSMETRIGLDALIENFSATDILKNQSISLQKIASTDNPRLQIDALHYISLTGDAKNKDFLEGFTKHNNQQVKDAAVEALETLNELIE